MIDLLVRWNDDQMQAFYAGLRVCEPAEWCGRCDACGLPICNCPAPRCSCGPTENELS